MTINDDTIWSEYNRKYVKLTHNFYQLRRCRLIGKGIPIINI